MSQMAQDNQEKTARIEKLEKELAELREQNNSLRELLKTKMNS